MTFDEIVQGVETESPAVACKEAMDSLCRLGSAMCYMTGQALLDPPNAEESGLAEDGVSMDYVGLMSSCSMLMAVVLAMVDVQDAAYGNKPMLGEIGHWAFEAGKTIGEAAVVEFQKMSDPSPADVFAMIERLGEVLPE